MYASLYKESVKRLFTPSREFIPSGLWQSVLYHYTSQAFAAFITERILTTCGHETVITVLAKTISLQSESQMYDGLENGLKSARFLVLVENKENANEILTLMHSYLYLE